MGLFKLVGTDPQVFLPVLIVYLKNKLPSRQKLLMSVHVYIAASNSMGSFVTQWHKKHAQLHTFYTNACILIPAITFYDAKPQLVKTLVAA